MKGESLFQPTSVKGPPFSSVIFPARNLIYRGFPGVSHSHLLICKGFPARHVWWHRRGPVLNHGDSARPNWLKPNWRLPSMGQNRRGGRRLVSSETRWLICPLVKRKRWRELFILPSNGQPVGTTIRSSQTHHSSKTGMGFTWFYHQKLWFWPSNNENLYMIRSKCRLTQIIL